jgi:hypothetical protein
VETERPENDLLDERGTDQGLLLQGTEMVEMIDGMSLLQCDLIGEMLRCRSGGRDDRGPPPAEANQGNNLHVSGLAKSVDVPMLEEAFGKIGKVAQVLLRLG